MKRNADAGGRLGGFAVVEFFAVVVKPGEKRHGLAALGTITGVVIELDDTIHDGDGIRVAIHDKGKMFSKDYGRAFASFRNQRSPGRNVPARRLLLRRFCRVTGWRCGVSLA
jgi:hypothetical protein